MGDSYRNAEVNEFGGILNKSILIDKDQVNGLKANNMLKSLKSNLGKKIKAKAGFSKTQEKRDARKEELKKKKSEAIEKKKQEREEEKLRKQCCEDCGGLKPPPPSVAEKKQAKLIKQRLANAKRIANNKRYEDAALDLAVKRLPEPIKAVFNVFGVGITQVKPEKISYKKLKKAIALNHPVDPLTNQKFEFRDNVTVDMYNLKLADALGCIKCYNCLIRCKQRCSGILLRKKDKGLKKPESMKDVPDDDKNDSYKGLSKAAVFLGEGSILYLQIMKTLGILCILLSVINIPLFMMYSSTAGDDFNFFNLNSMFEHLSIGNIGLDQKICQVSFLDKDLATDTYPEMSPIEINAKKIPFGKPAKMHFKCQNPDAYIYKIVNWGFLYKLDIPLGKFSSGKYSCKQVDKMYSQPSLLEKDPDYVEPEVTETEDTSQHSLVEQELEEAIIIENQIRAAAGEVEINDEYVEAIMDPEKFPEVTTFNIDKECDINTMFISQRAKLEFYRILQEQCYLQNSCEIDPGKMVQNLTMESGTVPSDEIDDAGEELLEVDPEGKWFTKSLKMSAFISKKCYERIFDQEVTNIEYIGVFGCISDKVKFRMIPNAYFHKEELGIIVIFSDIASVIVLYYIFGKLKAINQEYLQILDDNVIKMQDFSVQIQNIQVDNTTQDIRILKLKVWIHFAELLKNLNAKSSESSEHLDIADVQFSLSKQDKHYAMYKLQEFKARIVEVEALMKSNLSPADRFARDKELTELQDKYGRFRDRYLEAIELEEKYAFNPSTAPSNKLIQQVEYTYITFKSNQSPKKALELFVKEPTTSKVARRICCIQDEVKDNIEFESQILNVTKTVDPDQILWDNIGFTAEQVRIRAICAFLAQILTAFCSILITQMIKKLKSQTRGTPDCPAYTIHAEHAWEEQNASAQVAIARAKVENPRISDEEMNLVGYHHDNVDEMKCFCEAFTFNGIYFWKFFMVHWDDYDPEGNDDTNYCLRWIRDLIIDKMIGITSTFSMIGLNGIIAYVFGHLSKFKKKHTTISEQSTGFSQIFFMEFFNMGCIMLLSSFDPSGLSQRLAGSKNPKVYQGFNNTWYQVFGKKLCLTLFMMTATTNIKELRNMQSALFKRIKDRGYLPNLKKDVEDEDDDETNTQTIVQKDVEALYTGGKFAGEKTFSRMMSTLLVIITYSSGMPVLYLVGSLFFCVTFIVNKALIISFYQKTLTLNRVVPNFSMQFLNISIFIHIIIGCFMLTDPSLFETISEPGEGMKMPNIGIMEDLGQSQDVENEDIENNISPDAEEEEESFKEKLITNIQARTQYSHQQIYIMFVVSVFVAYFCGKFIATMLLWVFKQAKEFFISLVSFIKSLLTNIWNWIKRKWKVICDKVTEKFKKMVKKHCKKTSDWYEKLEQKWKRKKDANKVEIAKKEILELIKSSFQDSMKNSQQDLDSNEEEITPARKLLMAQNEGDNNNNENAQKMSNFVRSDLQKKVETSKNLGNGDSEDAYEGIDMEDPEAVAARNRLLERFRLQIEKPYWSDNIYLELSIPNLKKFYDRSLKELKDVFAYFGIQKDEHLHENGIHKNRNRDNEQLVVTEVPPGRKKSEERIEFEERCYITKLSFKEVIWFFSMQKKRIKDIEEVIDSHFNNIKKEILRDKSDKLKKQLKKDKQEQSKMDKQDNKTMRTDMSKRSQKQSQSKRNSAKGGPGGSGGKVFYWDKQNKAQAAEIEDGIERNAIREKLAEDPDLQFENPLVCTYQKKLEQLDEYEDILLKIDKKKKENRRGLQTICRMQGSLSQSYFLWDAQQHKIARNIYYELEGLEPEELSDNESELNEIYQDMTNAQRLEYDKILEDERIEERQRVDFGGKRK